MGVRSAIETLEHRLMLAAADPAQAEFHGKLQSELLHVVQDLRLASKFGARTDSTGDVQIDLHIRGKLSADIPSLQSLGARIGSLDEIGGVVEAWAPPATVAAISAIKSVTAISIPDYRVVHAGSVDTAGDSLLGAERVRNQFAAYGIDGSGVKVGVISDGVDHRQNVGNDLPSVNINSALPGSGDEGTAMLEIIHDLAPGAQLFFSGPSTSVDMVASIGWLMQQGCNVIVDDLGFYEQPYFADGSIAQAAASAVSSGVVYISAAGNESTLNGAIGDFHYQHEFVDDPVFDGDSIEDFHNFGTAAAPDDYMDFNLLPGGSMQAILQWSDPFGGSTNDYDLRLFADDHTTILASSDHTQDGTEGHDCPLEEFSYDNPSSTTTEKVALRIRKFSGDPRELEMFVLGDVQPLEYATPAGSIIGQTAAPGVMAVGAIDAADPGTDTVDYYSSEGPRTIFTDFDAQTSIQRNVLSGVAVDDVQTRVGQLHFFSNPFLGTSAAAPHAAGIAALVKDAAPTLSGTTINGVMQDTAVDLTSYGVGYDQVSGSGRFNALDAVYKVFTPAQTDLTASSDTGVSPFDNLTNDNTPTLTGIVPPASYVTVYVDGVANNSVQVGTSVATYSVTTTPLADGSHSITIRIASSSAVSAANRSYPSPALTVVIDTTPPAAPSTPDLAPGSDTGISNSDNITRVSNPQFTGTAEVGSAVRVLADGNSTSASGTVATTGTWAVSSTQLSEGAHSITATATDAAGNTSQPSAALNIVIDRTPPTVTPAGFEYQNGYAVDYLLSEDLTATMKQADLTIRRQPTNAPLSTDSFTVQVTPSQGQYLARYTFGASAESIFSDANYTAMLSVGDVTDVAGNEPASVMPSSFFVLRGDANRDRRVNALDFNALASSFGKTGALFSDGDFNHDGTVNTADFTLLASRFGATVISPTGTSPTGASPTGTLPAGDLFSPWPVQSRDDLTDILIAPAEGAKI